MYVQYLHPNEMTNQLKKAINQAFKQIDLDIANDRPIDRQSSCRSTQLLRQHSVESFGVG